MIFNRYSKSLLKTNNDLELALFSLQKAAELTPKNYKIQTLLGLVYEIFGQLNNAAECFKLALDQVGDEVSLTSIQLNLYLGRVLCGNSEYDASLVFFTAALAHVDLLSEHDSVSLYLNLGIIYYFLDKLEDSLENFEIALEKAGDNSSLKRSALVLVSRALWKLGSDEHKQAAIEMLLEW